MPALKPATIGQKFLTDCGQNRPLTTIKDNDETDIMPEKLAYTLYDVSAVFACGREKALKIMHC